MSRCTRFHRLDVRRLLNAIGPVFGLVLVVGLFSLNPTVRSHFFTGINCKIILLQTVIVAIGALGMTMIIVSAGIDLSVGSVVALTSVVGATSLVKGCSPAAAIVLTIAVGAGIGLLNGLIVAGLRMMPFIVTLGMMGVARGTAKWLADNQTVNAPKSSINNLMDMLDPLHFFPLPLGIWITVALAIAMAVVMQRTIFGRYLFAIGSNEATARLCGIRVGLMKVAIYSLAGFFFGLAGLMQLSRPTQGDPTVAIGRELGITAAGVIGGRSLSRGTGRHTGAGNWGPPMAAFRRGATPTNMADYGYGNIY